MLKQIINKYKFDNNADRIGPDLPFTHWKLYFQKKMLSLCKKKFKIFSDTAQFRPGAYAISCSKIEIGKGVVIRPGCMLFGESDSFATSIVIEDDVMMGSGVHIYTNNHNFNRTDIPIIGQGYSQTRPVVLHKGCWIGANCIILPGVEIGENTVIGAGSIVTKSFPKGVIAAGNPAKCLK